MVWYKLLQFLPDEIFIAACDELMTHLEGTRVPNPRRIQEAACDILGVRKGEEAWERFVKSVAGGAERAPIPDGAVEAGVKACGGAAAIGRADYSQHPYLKRDFIAAYEGVRLTLLRPKLAELGLLGAGGRERPALDRGPVALMVYSGDVVVPERMDVGGAL